MAKEENYLKIAFKKRYKRHSNVWLLLLHKFRPFAFPEVATASSFAMGLCGDELFQI